MAPSPNDSFVRSFEYRGSPGSLAEKPDWLAGWYRLGIGFNSRNQHTLAARLLAVLWFLDHKCIWVSFFDDVLLDDVLWSSLLGWFYLFARWFWIGLVGLCLESSRNAYPWLLISFVLLYLWQCLLRIGYLLQWWLQVGASPCLLGLVWCVHLLAHWRIIRLVLILLLMPWHWWVCCWWCGLVRWGGGCICLIFCYWLVA